MVRVGNRHCRPAAPAHELEHYIDFLKLTSLTPPCLPGPCITPTEPWPHWLLEAAMNLQVAVEVPEWAIRLLGDESAQLAANYYWLLFCAGLRKVGSLKERL
jgi:hypothetical protein